MKRTLLAILISGIGFTACNKQPEPLTKDQIKQKIDSITAMRIKELDAQSMQDLEHRKKIEVKVKADSMVKASIAADTLHKISPTVK